MDYYVDAKGLQALTLYLYDTYGPQDQRRKLFALLNEAAQSGTVLKMSPGEQLLDLLYIDDVTAGFVVAFERLAAAEAAGHQRYALASGQPIRLKDLVRLYEEIRGVRVNVEWGGRPYRPREVMIPWRTRVLLPGWRPAVDLARGVRLMEGIAGGEGAS